MLLCVKGSSNNAEEIAVKSKTMLRKPLRILVGVLIGVLLLAALASGIVVWWKRTRSQEPATCPLEYPRGKVRIESNPSFFYCQCSTTGSEGRRIDGGYYENDVLIEPGLSSVDDLNRFPLTFAMGSSHYKGSEFGVLRRGSWSAYTACFDTRLSAQLNGDLSKSVLVVEEGVVILDLPILDVTGIVVRKAGILLVQGNQDAVIRTQFILVESGGLFQAGAQNPQYRFQPKLEIWMTHPSGGYDALGSVSSQYSYQIYAPGARVKEENAGGWQTAYTGESAFDNMMDCKSIGCGFNGNITLAGRIGDPLPYKRTWNVYDEKGELFLNPDDSLLYFASEEEAKLQDIQFSYPLQWARLTNSLFPRGSQSIQVDPLDVPGLRHWKAGDEVVISGKSNQYQVFGDPQGLLPFFVGENDPQERAANEQATAAFLNKFKVSYQGGPIPDKSNGVEVAEISQIDYDTGIISFAQPLQFAHDSRYQAVDRSTAPGAASGKIIKTIYVGTCLHVGLLTRNITIRSELTSGGSGANVMTRTASEGTWRGPGGQVVCNNGVLNPAGREIFEQCYQNKPLTNAKFCNNESPGAQQRGSFVYGSSQKTGSNAILGAQCIFRNGSSVTIDGVEFKHMGIAANFGQIGRYPLHFHLAGWPRDWDGYLPPNAGSNRRDATIANCSNWCSFNRHVVMHGVHNVSVRNNVFFLSMGSGLFVEDGTELQNTIEHNLSLLTLLTDTDPYYNSAGIYATASSDIAAASAIWLKNSQNRVLRNVLACGPSPVLGLWIVPQNNGALRGPSTVCLGDPIRKLPALGSFANALGNASERAYLSQQRNNWTSVSEGLGLTKPCWTPPEFSERFTFAGTNGCLTYSARNDLNPYGLVNDGNCFYNLMESITNFPEQVAALTPDYNGVGGFNAVAGQSYKSSLVGYTPGPQWMAASSQNSCTDSEKVSGGIYVEGNWGGTEKAFPYQPISQEELKALDAEGNTVSLTSRSTTLPMILSGYLHYNLGATNDLLSGGWIKQGPVFCWGCCFLETSLRLINGNENNPATKGDRMSPRWGSYASNFGTTTCGIYDACYSGMFQASVIGSPKDLFGAIYSSFDNCIWNGGFAIPSNPCLYTGPKLFFGDRCIILTSEYNGGTDASANGTIMYFSGTPVGPRELISDKLWLNRDSNIQRIKIVDFDHNVYESISGLGRSQGGLGSLPQKIAPIQKSSTRKYPYVCGSDGQLLKMGSTPFAIPRLLDVVGNVPLGCFTSTTAIKKGNKLCSLLREIEPQRK